MRPAFLRRPLICTEPIAAAQQQEGRPAGNSQHGNTCSDEDPQHAQPIRVSAVS
jgi:hypothetical protein